MKPDFMVIGAAKCATTTIRWLFRRHPELYVVPEESQFFNDDGAFARGFDWHASRYAAAGSRQLRGEVCNGCTMKERYPRAFERLTAFAGRLKLFYLVRDPFDRIESFWLELRSQHPDYVHYDFDKAVHLNRDWLADASNYLAQLEPYRQFYGDESIHVVFYEDFRADPARVIRDCFRFLGVDPDVDVTSAPTHLNASEGKSIALPILSQLRSISLYRRAVDRLPFAPRDWIARKLFYRRVLERPRWKPQTREWVADLLRDDLHVFLKRYGKPDHFWKLDGDAEGGAPVPDAWKSSKPRQSPSPRLAHHADDLAGVHPFDCLRTSDLDGRDRVVVEENSDPVHEK